LLEKIVAQRSRSSQWLVRYPRAAPLAIFFLVAAITLLSVFAIERVEDQRASAQLRERAVAIGSALERRASANSSYLRAGAALLSTMDTISAERYRRFVSDLRLESDYRGADGIGWAPLIEPDQVEAYNSALAAAVPGARGLNPPLRPPQPFAVPVTFLQPDTLRNRRALGYDMYSEPVRRTAMSEAEQAVRPTASGKVELVQEGGAREAGFLIYMPVFRDQPNGRLLRGFIYSPFNAEDFLASALELESVGNYGIRLYDRAFEPGNLMATYNTRGERGRVWQEMVSIANHPWVLRVEGGTPNALSTQSMLTLLFGLLVAFLLTLVARLITQQAVEDSQALEWFEEQASIRNSLTRELNHRVKNTLANVLSIVALTRRRAETINEFAAGLEGRIRALSATHDLLTQSDWGTVPIQAVIEAELAPYANSAEQEVEIAGPHVELAPNDALSLGLAIHELATNAAKFGALSLRGGKVQIRWDMINERLARINWSESGGPPVSAERKRGFGTDLIEKIVAHELKTPVDLRFEKEGVRCSLTIPVRQPAVFEIRRGK
jgi:two-component sensor histidine kinase/CHASE1-domain containing sensor protein